jgi:hypothetical protein
VGGDDDGALGDVLTALAESRAAAQVVDAEGRLAWVSEQMLLLAGADAGTDVGIGHHVDEVLERPVWRELLTAGAAETLRAELHPRLTDPGTTPLWVLAIDLQVGARPRCCSPTSTARARCRGACPRRSTSS